MICDFITSLAHLRDLDWVLEKYEYWIFSCIGLNNEYPSSFVNVTEGEVNVETNELFDVEILPFLVMLLCSVFYSISAYWLSVGTGNIT